MVSGIDAHLINKLKNKSMKKTILLLFIINFFIFQFGNTQSNYYYYYKGNKVYLELDKARVNIITNQDFNTNETSEIGLNDYILEQDRVLSTNKIGKTEFINEPTIEDFYQKINLLKNIQNINGLGLYFKKNDSTSIGTSNFFYVKLKTINDFSTLQNFCIQKNVQIVKQVSQMPEWYILSTTNTLFTSLDLSNEFYESNLFADVDPAFMFNFGNATCANDADFGSLWGLNNVVNPSLDINACQAWTISEGANVNVAVLDQGIYTIHQDLAGNISTTSFDANTGTSPSEFNTSFNHGTHVAGIIGAIKDNNMQVVGVAPQCKIMPVSHDLDLDLTISADLANGISWATLNDAKIINNSWGDKTGSMWQLHSTILENAIDNAINNGVIVVFATHNNSGPVSYPANHNPKILAVGSMAQNGLRAFDSNYGSQVDVVAPGVSILSTMPFDQIGFDDGTSMAAPHVSGVAALILSINPCLSAQQVRDIIELTAQKVGGYSYTTTAGRPNGTWNNEMGYGLVDAYAAVMMAQSMNSPTLDLMIKDSQHDIGIEPNTVTPFMWTSDDIWVRNNNDNGLIHQNPQYSAFGTPNYVKVRVINKSCVSSTGNEQLNLYWAKASTALAYPNPWFGGVYHPTSGATMGNPIGAITIPVLAPGGEVILSFPWQVPNPADYGNDGTKWHFCLLARIEATSDPMTVPETIYLTNNVANNNNIAWKNITVINRVELLPNDPIPVDIVNLGGMIGVGNPYNHSHSFLLELKVEDLETGKPIYQESEIRLKMDDVLFNAWERGGKENRLLESTSEQNLKLVKDNNAILDNIVFEPNEFGSLQLDFNFLMKELTDKTSFAYHVIQKDAVTGQIIGGETFIINKTPRSIFRAEAPDKEVDLNQSITISAEDINEPAIYNWYNNSESLIYQGKNLQIANAVAEKFKLEVIATTDGFKDYKDVEVKLKPSRLENISPNPASNNVLVNYKLNGATSAYIMVIGYYRSSGISNNYILDLNVSEINIDISNYPIGFYTVALVVNGDIVDASILNKE